MKQKFLKCKSCGASIKEDNLLLHKSKVHPLDLTEAEKKLFEKKEPNKGEVENWLEKITSLRKEKGKSKDDQVEWELLASMILDAKKQIFDGVERLSDPKVKERLIDRLERYGEYVEYQLEETASSRIRTKEKALYELSALKEANQKAILTFKDMPQDEIFETMEQNLEKQVRANAFSKTMDRLKAGDEKQKELAGWVERNFEYLTFIEKYSIISEEKSPDEEIRCLYTFFTLTAELGEIKNPSGMDDTRLKEVCINGLEEMKVEAEKKRNKIEEKTEKKSEAEEKKGHKEKKSDAEEKKDKKTASEETKEVTEDKEGIEKHLRILDLTLKKAGTQNSRELLSDISKCFSTKYIEKPEVERLIVLLRENWTEAGAFLEKNYRRIKKFEGTQKEDQTWLNVFSVMLNVPDIFLSGSGNLKKFLSLFVGAFAKAPKQDGMRYLPVDQDILALAEKEVEPLSVEEIFAKITGTIDKLSQQTPA